MKAVYIGNNAVNAIYVGNSRVKIEDRFLLENEYASAYIKNTDYSADVDYTYNNIDTYMYQASGHNGDLPLPITITWESGTYSALRVDVSLDSQFESGVWSYAPASSATSISIYNLIPNKHYYYRVSDGETIIKTGELYTLGKLRMLNIPNCRNFRDIGGWSIGTNQRLKYGRLIRGVDVDEPMMPITESGIIDLVNRIGITTEIDFGDNASIPLSAYGVESLYNPSLYGIGAYNNQRTEEYPLILESFTTPDGRQKYNNALSVVIDRLENNGILYLHCNAGCDRTGTLFFLIEALLGMSESDLAKEYELSSFYSQRTRNGYIGGYAPGTVSAYNYKTMIFWIRANYQGSTINEKVYDLCTKSIENGGIGLTAQQINNLRGVMIESNLT